MPPHTGQCVSDAVTTVVIAEGIPISVVVGVGSVDVAVADMTTWGYPKICFKMEKGHEVRTEDS